MHPRFLILHCLEYGRYGITPTILRAELVLQAYAMINSSIMLLFTSLETLKFKMSDKIQSLSYWQMRLVIQHITLFQFE